MNSNSSQSFFSKLKERRFFQYLGSYLLGVWGLVQFIDWITDRFDYNSFWSETVLFIGALLIPTAILIIYFHGQVGTQKWSKLEKIFIPINLIVAGFLAINFFVHRNLEDVFTNHPEKIVIYDEDGNEIQRFVPKTVDTRRIITFPLVNKSDDNNTQWQSLGLPTLLAADIEQDNRLYAINPFSLKVAFIDYGYDISQAVPFSIQRKIGDDYYADLFFTGSYKVENENYQINIEAFTTQDGKSFYKTTKEGNNYFDLIDEVTQEFQQQLSLPDVEKDVPLIDLPSSNLFSEDPVAFQGFIAGLSANMFENAPQKAVSLLKKAIKKDPNCIECQSRLGQFLFRVNKIPEALQIYKKAMQRIDVLPERQQLKIKYWNYFANRDLDKAIALANMWMQFYPNDYIPYANLSQIYLMRSDIEKAKEVSKKAIEVGHKGKTYLKMADLALIQDNVDEAKKYYKLFQEAYPHKAKETKGLANVYIKEGEYDKAREHLKNLAVLNSGDESILHLLSKVEHQSGNSAKAISYLKEALANSKNAKDSIQTLAQLEGYYTNIGLINESIQLKYDRLELQKAFYSPLENELEFMTFPVIMQFLNADKKTEIVEKLKQFTEYQNPSYPGIYCGANLNLALAVADIEKSEKFELECRDYLIKSQGPISYLMIDALLAEIKGDYTTSVQKFEQFKTATKAQDLFIETILIRNYRLGKQFEKARLLAIQQLKSNALSAEVHYELGLIYLGEGKTTEAINSVKKALEVWKDADDNFLPAKRARETLAEMQS